MIDKELQQKLIGSYCVCHNVTYNEIDRIVKNNQSITEISDIRNIIECANTCKLCVPDIQAIINYYQKN